MLEHEARPKISVQAFFRDTGHLEAPCRALGNCLVDLADIQPRSLGIGKCLAYPRQRARNGNLVARLGLLPRACGANMNNVLSHREKNRLQRLKCLRIAPHEDAQGRISRPRVPACHRRIHRKDPLLLCRCIDAFRKDRGGRCHIHHIGACPRTGKNPVLAEIDLLYVLRIAHNGNDNILSLRTGTRRTAPFRAARYQIIRLGLRPIVNAHLKPRIQQMPCHRSPHDAEPDKTDFFHKACPPSKTRIPYKV